MVLALSPVPTYRVDSAFVRDQLLSSRTLRSEDPCDGQHGPSHGNSRNTEDADSQVTPQ